jgi:riboflavin synthase
MFTGIIQATGRVVASDTVADGIRLRVDAAKLDLADVGIGDSIAVNGCCLTVVAKAVSRLDFDVSAETLACTTGLTQNHDVNLEKALRLADRLGGHLMSGHVDGVGIVTRFAPLAADPRSNWDLEIEAPLALAPFLARKGSIAVDGVSLTTNDVNGSTFTVNLIPHTLAATTLHQLMQGSRVNLEVDLVARYVQRMLDVDRGDARAGMG